MNGTFKLLLLIVVTMLMSTGSVFGQRRTYRPGFYLDRAIRTSVNDIARRYDDRWLPNDSTYVVPHGNGNSSNGTYYVRNGEYYYVPHRDTDAHAHTPAPVTFGGFSHVGDLAKRLETLANEFCLDLHYNYAHNPGYRETYREAYSLLQLTKNIVAAEHQNDREAIRRELTGMHPLFHHIEDDVRGWSRQHRRQIGHRGISSKLAMLESTLHHLMNDVGVRESALRPTEAAVEQAPPPEAS